MEQTASFEMSNDQASIVDVSGNVQYDTTHIEDVSGNTMINLEMSDSEISELIKFVTKNKFDKIYELYPKLVLDNEIYLKFFCEKYYIDSFFPYVFKNKNH